jgi:hypothetical protein
MKRLTKTTLVACMASALFTGSAHAALITSASSLGPATVIDFQQFAGVAFANTTPVQVGVPVGEDVELFGIGASTFVGPVSHGLGGNGSWNSTTDVNFRSVRLPTGVALAMEFVFNTAPVRGIGGFMNYAPGTSATVLIEAFDAGGTLLESYDLLTAAPINTSPTSVNDGAFRGILRTSADITRLRVSSAFAVLDDLTFTRVPEPASVSLLVLGGLGALTRGRGDRS